MGSSRVRADYAGLQNIAKSFNQQADAVRQTLTNIQGAQQTLEGGDWVGRGATVFYQEMNSAVLPSLKRLGSALENAAQVTQKISKIMKQAEDDASRLFSAEAAALAAALGGGAAAAAGSGGSSGSGGSGGASGSGGSGGSSGASGSGAAVGPTTSGPFHLGPPQRPNIRHDNGFLDSFPTREPTLGDRANLLLWRGKLEAAEAFRPDLADGTAAYRHFLDGNGADRQFSYERFVENDPSGQTTLNNLIADAQRNAETLGQGRTNFSLSSEAYSVGGNDARFPYPQTENWQKAIGGHSVWTSADVQVTGTGSNRTYTMTMTVHAEDRYNFNPGAQDIATGIPDDANGQFELTGLAHQYTNRGELTRVITWREGDIANAEVVDLDTSRNRRPGDNVRARNRI